METESNTLPAASHVGRVALCVNDLDQMVDFYRDVVGLSVQHHESERATLGSGDEPLLELLVDPDAPERRRDETGLFHTAFLLPDRAALGDALQRVREQWRLDGASDHHVSEALYLSDPEGNGIEIYRDRPREEWPHENDGSVRMATLPLDLDEIGDLGQGAPTVPDGTVIGHVHLEVSSLQKAREFYVDTLGMNVRQRYGESALFVAAGEYHHHIGLNMWNGRTASPSGRGLAWFELVVPGQEALDALRERLDDRDVPVTATDDGLAVDDPNGIRLRVRSE